MMKRFLPLLLSCTLLTGCFGLTTEKEEAPAKPIILRAAQESIITILQLVGQRRIDSSILRPAGATGLYASSFLAYRSIPELFAAVRGVELQLQILPSIRPEDDQESFALLSELGAILEINIPEFLNRSTERSKDLDSYTQVLEGLLKQAALQREVAAQRGDVLDDERKEKSSEVKAMEREIDRALKDRNYSAASSKQEELIPVKTRLATLEIQTKQFEDITDIFDDLLEVGSVRLNAITQNRDALLAGIKVIDVPGIDELDLIRGRSGLGRRRSGGNPFGTLR